MIDPILLAERAQAIAAVRAEVRPLVLGDRPSREALEAVRSRLETLAARRDLFGPDAFAPSRPPARFPLGEEPDGRLSFSLVVLPPGIATAPHAHGTWAVIAAVAGEEVNRLYRQGPSGLLPIEEVVVRPGRGIVLLPEDIHATVVAGPGHARLLKLYGVALERAPRRAYDPLTGLPLSAAPAQAG
ncbi:MAG: cysteine dioxygenase [Elioraea sp.]|nr:cysteine dioxygenase [Elioraea sp.]